MDALAAIDLILETNAPYWAGEYSIAFAYFTGSRRSTESDIKWIRLQMYKEWTGSGVYPERSITSLVEKGLDELRAIEDGKKRPAPEVVHYYLNFALDEFDHYEILFRIHSQLSSEAIDSIWRYGELEEARKLERVRETYRSLDHGMEIVGLSEGGGLGMYFGMRDAFNKIGVSNKTEELMLEFANKTIDDEKNHMLHRFMELVDCNLSSNEWIDVNNNLTNIFSQKLAERNAQFSYVFPIETIIKMHTDRAAGKIYLDDYLSFLRQDVAKILQRKPL